MGEGVFETANRDAEGTVVGIAVEVAVATVVAVQGAKPSIIRHCRERRRPPNPEVDYTLEKSVVGPNASR